MLCEILVKLEYSFIIHSFLLDLESPPQFPLGKRLQLKRTGCALVLGGAEEAGPKQHEENYYLWPTKDTWSPTGTSRAI